MQCHLLQPREPAQRPEVWAMCCIRLGFAGSKDRLEGLANERYRMVKQFIYRGQCFWAADVPFRLRGTLKQELHRIASPPPQRAQSMNGSALKILSWNASRNLDYHEWISWCNGYPADPRIRLAVELSMDHQCLVLHSFPSGLRQPVDYDTQDLASSLTSCLRSPDPWTVDSYSAHAGKGP